MLMRHIPGNNTVKVPSRESLDSESCIYVNPLKFIGLLHSSALPPFQKMNHHVNQALLPMLDHENE